MSESLDLSEFEDEFDKTSILEELTLDEVMVFGGISAGETAVCRADTGEVEMMPLIVIDFLPYTQINTEGYADLENARFHRIYVPFDSALGKAILDGTLTEFAREKIADFLPKDQPPTTD